MTRNSTKLIEQSTRGQSHTHSRTTNSQSQHGSSSRTPNGRAGPYDDVNIIERWPRDAERTERSDRDEGHTELRWERARRERGSIVPRTGTDSRRHHDANIIERSPRGVVRSERGDRERDSTAPPTAMDVRRLARRAGLQEAIETAKQDLARSGPTDRHSDRHERTRPFHQRMLEVSRRDLAEMDREDQDRRTDGGREARREREFAEAYAAALPEAEAGARDPKAFLMSLREGEPNYCQDRGCSCGHQLYFDLVKFLDEHPRFPQPNRVRRA